MFILHIPVEGFCRNISLVVVLELLASLQNEARLQPLHLACRLPRLALPSPALGRGPLVPVGCSAPSTAGVFPFGSPAPAIASSLPSSAQPAPAYL